MSHKKDYIEKWRRFYFPRVAPLLEFVGLYSTASVTEAQYVTSLSVSEEQLEKELLHGPHGWERNPVAAYKTHTDGRKSSLSLRLTHGAATEHYGTEYAGPGMQLHWTLLRSNRDSGTVDVYAHHEDDWAVSPIDHLRSRNMSAQEGVKRSLAFLKEETDYL